MDPALLLDVRLCLGECSSCDRHQCIAFKRHGLCFQKVYTLNILEVVLLEALMMKY